MKWETLINNILDLKEEYPNELKYLYITQDNQYINKYVIWFSKKNEIDNFNNWDIIETMTIIDNNWNYEHNMRYIIYFKTKEKWDIINVYYNNVLNKIETTNKWFIIDFINTLMV